MASIKDEVTIKTSVAKAYEALTSQAGYRGWWNGVAEVAQSEGGEAKLKFVKDGQPVNMRFRIDELKPNESVRWTCVAHDMPPWVDTQLSWTLRGSGDSVVVALDHSGWQGEGPEPVAQGWKHFLGSMKSYLETGTGQPW
jgi:uncharacterized protein YndB with AHSA1/START domain